MRSPRRASFPCGSRAIRLDPAPLKSDLAAHLSMLQQVRDRSDEFDVIHFHIDLLHFPFFEPIADRTLTTLHGRLDLTDLPEVYRRWPQYPLVSISYDQRRPLPFANWIATVQHGVPPDLYRYCPDHRGYLTFLGRISPEKRPDRAIEIARAAQIPLKIAAKVDAVDKPYHRDVIAPLLAGPFTEFVGEVDDLEKNRLLGSSAALLFPIDWPEPFGLVMIEAMACGTPVIAWNRGSVPEVIEDGVTGFVVDSIDEAVAAIRRIETLDRGRIRATFERRFSAVTMARNYLRLYAQPRRTHRYDDHAGQRQDIRIAPSDRTVRA